MKVKIKRLSDKAVIPQYAKEGDAGMDWNQSIFELRDKLDNFIKQGK